jgi:two-component system response regulator AtoC
MPTTIFVVDDDPSICRMIQRRLERHGHHVRTFNCGEDALRAVDGEQPDIALVDLWMPGAHGLKVLREMKDKAPQSLIIILTAYGSIEEAVEAMKLGAHDFVMKRINLEPLEQVVQQAVELCERRSSREVDRQGSRYALTRLVADSQVMKHLKCQIGDLVQNGKSTVLLQGETGTGKEFIARVIHDNGPRNAEPFIAVNCTAIPGALFESELFGYERGAFGRDQRKIGLLEQAGRGTLFVDEIGDLGLTTQAKLLGVLRDRSFRRMGGTLDISSNFQLLAATNRNLSAMVKEGTFREDLFFRLNVVSLNVPPLRERANDIIPLAVVALARYANEFQKEIVDIDQEAKHVLQHYHYPGNIRELENIIERAVIFCHGQSLTKGCLPAELYRSQAPVTWAWSSGNEKHMVRIEVPSDETSLANVECALIQHALQSVNYNKTLAARKLGITRYSLMRKLQKFETQVESGVLSHQSHE